MQKLVPDPFLILQYKLKQSLQARNSFKSKIFLKEDYQKALKKLTLYFLSKLVPFNEQSYQKQKGHFSGYKTSSEKFLYLLHII